jgi:hypothetical protein
MLVEKLGATKKQISYLYERWAELSKRI